jgi:hypothetical protein
VDKRLVSIVSWSTEGRLEVELGLNTYTYYGVPEFQYRRLKMLISKGNLSATFRLLKSYSDRGKSSLIERSRDEGSR